MKTRTLTDIELITSLKGGDTKKLKSLYVHMSYIKRIATNNNGSVADGEDLFQETLIIFYENLQKSDFVLTSSIKSYLYGIANNLWLKHLREIRKEESGKNNFKKDMPLIQEQSTDFEKIDRLKTALNNLDELCLNLLLSYYYHNLSMELIAKKYSYKTEQVARQQKYRCMQKIKNLV